MISKEKPNSPIYADGEIAQVGDWITNGSDPLKIIVRIDSNTEQVWYKRGGFDWFENMKNYGAV